MANTREQNTADRVKGMLWGLVVGDCLGSPVQFTGKDDHPFVDTMLPCDIFDLPPGYWTDDSSMAFCIMDSYLRSGGYDLQDIANTFLRWYRDGYLSSVDGRSFDVGNATSQAMYGVAAGSLVNGREQDQGNGSIMRLAPAFLIQRQLGDDTIAAAISNITHNSVEVRKTVQRMCSILESHLRGERTTERSSFTTREEVNNSGWCVSTLDAALWAFNSTDNFRDGMIAAVNLGGDADTIGAVYGQIAGAYYGFEAIPLAWRRAVHRTDWVADFIQSFSTRVLSPLPSCPSHCPTARFN